MRNLILAIAVDTYESKELNTLKNCESDIKETLRILNERYVFDDTTFVFGRDQTTKRVLYNKLKDFFINALDNENILLLYAGHGQFDKILNVAYWQPSDSDPRDSSSWLNLTDLVSFIRATKAHHVSVISDSCFSGALFNAASRGGGPHAYSGKSREVLTSGGIETVSDGDPGACSPFSRTLNEILTKHSSDITFRELSQLLLHGFEPTKTQTPRFDSLKDVGHGYGSFTFTLQRENPAVDNRKNANGFLRGEFGHLYIPLSKDVTELLNKVYLLTDEKYAIVKKQQYERAAHVRDSEKKAIANVIKQFKAELETVELHERQRIKLTQEQVFFFEEFDKAMAQYDAYLESESKTNVGKLNPWEPGAMISPEEQISEGWWQVFQMMENPATLLLSKNQNKLIETYKKNIVDLFRVVVNELGPSKSENARTRINEFKEILYKVFEFQLEVLISSSIDPLAFLMTIKEKDLNVLKWIKSNTRSKGPFD
jgi:hypothetical protein